MCEMRKGLQWKGFLLMGSHTHTHTQSHPSDPAPWPSSAPSLAAFSPSSLFPWAAASIPLFLSAFMAVSTNLSGIVAAEAAWQAFRGGEFTSPSFCCQGTCWKECSSTAQVCQVWLMHRGPGNGTLWAKTECPITQHLPQQSYSLIPSLTKSFIHNLELFKELIWMQKNLRKYRQSSNYSQD